MILGSVKERFIRILRRTDRRLVAVVELLSPSNKKGDRRDYLAKRQALLREKVHLVELDLLLGGRRVPMAAPLPPGDYFAILARAEKRLVCDVYGWGLRDPLPAIPIPLEAPDADVVVPLGDLFRVAYERGRYERFLYYADKPPVRLAAEDDAWVRAGGGGARPRFAPPVVSHAPANQWQQPLPASAAGRAGTALFAADGGTSLAGLRSKKPLGFSKNPMYAAGMTG